MIDTAKLAMYAGAAILISVLAYKAYDAIGDAREAQVVARYQKALDAEKARVKQAEATARSISEAKEHERLRQTSELQSRIDELLSRPSPGIRLCQRADSSSPPGVSQSPSSPDVSSAGNGPDMRAGEDIERPLVQFAQRCESDRTQLLALQNWIREQEAAWQ